MSSNLAILAAAGSCKTQYIIDEALRDPARQILITTYTNENLAQIRRRLGKAAGIGLVSDNISTMSWYTFLISQCAKPYQRSLLEQPNVIRSLNFHGERKQYVKREQTWRYFLDSNADMQTFSPDDQRMTLSPVGLWASGGGRSGRRVRWVRVVRASRVGRSVRRVAR